MSIKSTHWVTRDFAIEAIFKKLETINNISNKKLAYLLEEVVDNEYYNFTIVSEKDLENNRNEEWPRKFLDNINELPERDGVIW